MLSSGKGGDVIAIYVAFRETQEEGVPTRQASPSMDHLRGKVRQYPGSQWRIGKAALKWTVDQVCQAIEEALELPFDEDLGSFIVTTTGRVQRKKNGHHDG